MSKYIDEIHACAGDERETMALMEKSVTKILQDVVLFIVLIFFYTGVLKSSAATIPETATISTGTVIGMYTVIYGGLAVFIYLFIRHLLPFFVLGIPYCFVLLFNVIKSRFFAKNKDVPSIPTGPDSRSSKNTQETVSDGENSEQRMWNYLKPYKKYIYGFAFQWLSANGNLGGMSRHDFRDYVKQKTGCSVSSGTVSTGAKTALECTNNKCVDELKKKEYDNMTEVFNSLIKKNELLPGILKKSNNN